MFLKALQPLIVGAVVIVALGGFATPVAAAPGEFVTNPDNMVCDTPAAGKIGVMPGDNVQFPGDENPFVGLPDVTLPHTKFDPAVRFPTFVFDGGCDLDGSDPVVQR